MKKQRMTADNVEQLMEIVRALQTGEDPAEALERKKAESAPQADSPKSNQENDLPEEKKQRQKRKRPEKAEFHDDEFEENLHEENIKRLEMPDVNTVLDCVSEWLWKVVQTVDLVIEPLTSWRPERKGVKPPKDGKKPEKTDPEEAGKLLGEEDDIRETASEAEAEFAEAAASEAEVVSAEDTASGAESESESAEDTGAETEVESDGEETAAETEDRKTLNRILDQAEEQKEAKKEEKKEELKESVEELADEGKKSDGFLAKLGEKGIHCKEIIMILLVAVLAVAIIALVVNGIRNSMEQKRKSANVTADKGLTVTVEQEPEEWCSQAEIQLRFRTPRVPVTSVMINGEVLQPDAKGYVTYTATAYLLEAEAETENGTLKAKIEIPKLDCQAPAVYASKEQNQITLTGSDSRSSIKAVWYAVLRKTDVIRLPRYQEYTGTIPFESDVLYYFYAVDAAGNKSTPVVTNMETAESISFIQEEIAMYPDEIVYLELEETPKGALLNNLRYESMNPDIVSVDAGGKVTALKEGTAAIKVSADGIESATCIIQVSRTRTVTISAIGDCTLGSDESFNTTTSLNAFAAMNGHDYFFKNVKEILENDDATFANLECVLTAETSRASKTYAFKGDPSYTEILTEGSVEVVTLANNHNNDYGEKSYEDTVKYLKEAGIAYCDGDQIAIQDVNGVKTAFIGIYVLRDGIAKEEQVKSTIAAAKEAGAELVIMAFHWGSEKSTQPDSTQKSLAHTAIDSGADLVVGHHPHVLQGIEQYNGKYIVYSLANFCFGGNTAPSDKDTVIFRQTFTFTDGMVQDDAQIEIIPCSVSSAADYNNYQPSPATGTEAERIMGRINEYSQEFGQTYTASDGLL